MADELKHWGIKGMRWGVRRKTDTNSGAGSSKASPSGNKKVDSLLSRNRNKKASDLISQTKSDTFGEKVAKFYGMKQNRKGQWEMSLKTIPMSFATALIAAQAKYSIQQLLSGNLNVYTAPGWMKFLAWNTGKVMKNSPLR